MRFLAVLIILLVLASSGTPQDACEADDRCGAGMCLVWEDGRQVCSPKSYRIAVWDSECIDKIEKTPDSRIEAPLNFDGSPATASARLVAPRFTIKSGCQYRVETRTK